MYDDLAIELKKVSKYYKIFKSKTHRFLDLFGFPIKNFELFWVLRDVNLKIKKGEKVGFIGKNGAGKTTLLKIIAGNIKPNSGSVKVKGKIQALFTLGTGFHPEFTGRENILSALAYQGITGNLAKKIIDEIIEFTELEDFIDQPVRTYSAGMYARLAFAVTTAVKPDILIVDEILGVGDAYFYSKAVERMNELIKGGTTVLFVSHDLSAVQKLCDRVIWINKGKIYMDGNPLDIIKAYLHEIRKEEEIRLKAKNTGISKKLLSSDNTMEQLIVRFIGENGNLSKEGIAVHKIQLFYKDSLLSEINVGDCMDNDIKSNAYIITDKEKINWSEPYKIEERWVRDVKDIGGKYKHAVAVFKIPKNLDKKNLNFKIIFFNKLKEDTKILFEVYENNQYNTIGVIESNKEEWQEISFPYPIQEENSEVNEEKIELDEKDFYGSEEVKIVDFKILDRYENERYVFTIGDYLIFRIHFEKVKDVPIKNPVFVVAIYDMKGECISQIISKEKGIDIGDLPKKGFVEIHIPFLRFGRGEYVISVAIFKELDLLDSKEPPAYCLIDRRFKFKVEQPFNINVYLGTVYQDVKFELSWKDEEQKISV